jgi:hypothetical protein
MGLLENKLLAQKAASIWLKKEMVKLLRHGFGLNERNHFLLQTKIYIAASFSVRISLYRHSVL